MRTFPSPARRYRATRQRPQQCVTNDYRTTQRKKDDEALGLLFPQGKSRVKYVKVGEKKEEQAKG